MARGKGRRGRGRGGKGQRAPIPERKAPSPNLTESPSPSNSTAVSEQAGESINDPRKLIQSVVDHVLITMRHKHQQLHDEDNESFPVISASQAAEAADAVVVELDDQVYPSNFDQESSNSGDGSPEVDVLQPLQHDYNLYLMQPDYPEANEVEVAGIQVERQYGSNTQDELDGIPINRIYYVDAQYFYKDDSDEVSISLENYGSPQPGEVAMMREAVEGQSPNLQQHGRPIPALNHIDMTPRVPSPADLDQIGSPPHMLISGTRKRADGSAAATAKLARGADKRRRMKTPPPPRQLLPRACKVVSKFTDAIKQRVVAYINQLKEAAEEEGDNFPDQTEDSWITVFIESAISVKSDFTPNDVRIWIDHFSQIFTPQAIRNLREHCSRLREQGKADDEASGSDVKYGPLENPEVKSKEEPGSQAK